MKSHFIASSTRQDILSTLIRVLPDTPGIGIIHSSLPRLLPPVDFSPWDALYALDALIQRGWTIALPAFTFSFCRGTPFNARTSPSETGILADQLLKNFPLALRTPHPIYSFVVLGARADEIASCPSTTTWGDDSPFGLFEREQATIVMLGCSWSYNTLFHRYEELSQVPYRYPKVFSGVADFGSGPHPVEAIMWVRDLIANPANDFSFIISYLRKRGLIASAPLWRGLVEAAAVGDLAEVCRSGLDSDCYAYVANAAQVAKVLAQRAEANAQPPLKIAVLGNSNLYILEQAWQTELAELLPERRIETYTLPFGQMRPVIIDPTSDLCAFRPHLRVFCDRLEDIVDVNDADRVRIAARVREYAKQIASFHQMIGGWSVIHHFAVMAPAADSNTLQANATLVARMNDILEEVLAPLPQIVWVDISAEAAAHNGPAFDPRLWYVGRFAFTDAFSRCLARRWTGQTLAMLGKTARLVVVDLDNTLWGGVLSEDGLTGINIGGDYPGNAFAAFQQALKTLPQRGIALAISSKNDEELVLSAFDSLSSMVLHLSDFSAWRINWQPKWQNIRDIAKELNIGLDFVLFVDDNPVEREAVRRNLPQVKLVELPPDPALYADTLWKSPYLAAVAITAEDRKRVGDLKLRQQRAIECAQAVSLVDYYAGLGMILHLSPLNIGNAQRAAQLCQKTNQFNTTTRRYDLTDLEKMAKAGADVVVIGLEDRHSLLENIGLIVLKPEDEIKGVIDLYLLSCRVLGRGIETVIPQWAIHRAVQRGWIRLCGEVIETERNTPVRKVFADAGFAVAGSGLWIAPTFSEPVLPDWLTIIDQVSQK